MDDKIPILRRASGGGTVLQGPGCLNYALIKQITKEPPFSTIGDTNTFIMTQHKEALSTLLPNIDSKGITDLTIGNIKISGNAQKRVKNALLFHGTFLYNFDLSKIETYLKMPPIQPDYRQNRPHQDFIDNIPLGKNDIVEAITKVWTKQR